MDSRIDRIAALANSSAYGDAATQDYIDGAPHIKHEELRQLYGRLLVETFDNARAFSKTPRVLDLGAGEGSATISLLELGAHVTAVDISESQLQQLRDSCGKFLDKLEVRCEDIHNFVDEDIHKYDVIVLNSFLHHVPDYLDLIARISKLQTENGQIFCFQDPMRYDSVGRGTLLFTKVGYFFWRIFKDDALGGIARSLRRARGVYLEDSFHDNTEYHVMRNGVDQDSIRNLLHDMNYRCDIVRYFSSQNSFFQKLGSKLGLHNTFAVMAQKRLLD